MESRRKVGKVKEAHGLKGDLFILIFSKDVSWLPQLKSFSLGLPDSNVLQSFTVQRAKAFKEGLMLKAEGIEDRTQAEKLKGQHFYISESLLESSSGETIFLSEIMGFEIEDLQSAKKGQITGFSTNGAQDLLVVQKAGGGEAEIPFVEAFIVKIDFETKIIRMNLPDGIWDLHAL